MDLSTRNHHSSQADIKNGPLQNGHTTDVDKNTNTDQKSSFRVLLVVFIGLLLDLMAFAVILPLLPSLLDHYSKDEEVSFELIFCNNTINIYLTLN